MVFILVFWGRFSIFGLLEEFEVPGVDIFDVLLGFFEWDSADAVDVSGACVVSGEDEVDIAVVAVGEAAQVPGSAKDILSWVEWVVNAHVFGGSGHELHEPHGADAADGARVKIAFDFNDGADEFRRDIIEV